jgi:hypothetical protein
MVSNMKTTVDLPEQLLRDAQELARRDHTTLKALIEAGLRGVLAEKSRAERFVLKDASVDGHGLQPEFQGASWDQLRDAIYGSPA